MATITKEMGTGVTLAHSSGEQVDELPKSGPKVVAHETTHEAAERGHLATDMYGLSCCKYPRGLTA